MTTLEQAARMAIEALNGSQYRMRGYGYQAMETTIASNNEAIEALRQALEQPPPKREWVGLTDEAIVAAYMSVGDKEWAIGGMRDATKFARAIEAAHGIGEKK